MRPNTLIQLPVSLKNSSEVIDSVHPTCTTAQVNPQIHQWPYAKPDHARKLRQGKTDLWLEPLILAAIFKCQIDNLDNLNSSYCIYFNRSPQAGTEQVRIIRRDPLNNIEGFPFSLLKVNISAGKEEIRLHK